MRRDVAEPVNSGGLEGSVRVEAAGDGLVNDGPLLFVEQLDPPLPGVDEPGDPLALPV